MGDLVCVRTFSARREAEDAQSLLQEQAIPALASADDAGGWGPHIMIGQGGARLLVHEQNADRAALLREAFGEHA